MVNQIHAWRLDEVPETCSQCDVYYDDGKPVYNHKPIEMIALSLTKNVVNVTVRVYLF